MVNELELAGTALRTGAEGDILPTRCCLELGLKHNVHALAFSFGQKGICNISEPVRDGCVGFPFLLLCHHPFFSPNKISAWKETI